MFLVEASRFPKHEKSPQPMSSMKTTIRFGGDDWAEFLGIAVPGPVAAPDDDEPPKARAHRRITACFIDLTLPKHHTARHAEKRLADIVFVLLLGT